EGAGPESIARREFLKNSMLAGSGLFITSRLLGDGSAQASAAALQRTTQSSTTNTVAVRLRVNGTNYGLRLDPRTSLLDLLREKLDLPGTKKGCNHGQCGACTILVDGRRINSCLALAVIYDGSEITTIEGLAKGDELHPMQSAFIRHEGFQCGYCTPGQICSAVAMLQEVNQGTVSHVTENVRQTGRVTLSDEEIRERMSGNICRCGAYPGIVAAIREVSGQQTIKGA
ncbi:MAG TPA: 2Fe-2S iron-sulfur cluster-binding protein, partial [Pyrinomonadaceae bacterium]|nr:2Fe-2S iron-sulfur cluster-binding protein [Pyrinomonadaceae bacterium]